MKKEQKVTSVVELKDIISKHKCLVFFQYHGISAGQITQLRRNLKSKGANVVVAKNTLARIAANEMGMDFLPEYLKGPLALSFADDPVTLSKTLLDFDGLENGLPIQVGTLDGNLMSKEEISALSKLGSLEETRAQLVGVLQGAQSKLVRVLQAAPASLVAVCNNYANK